MPSAPIRLLPAAVVVIPMFFFLGCASDKFYKPDTRYLNNPFHGGEPVRAEFAPAPPGGNARLKAADGSRIFKKADMERVASRLLRRYRGEVGEYSGVRDERYFLISIEPEVMVVAPFVYNVPLKTPGQIRGLSGAFTEKVLNPLFREVDQQRQLAQREGHGDGWVARVPGPNYAELGCNFPDLPGAVLWAAPLGAERPFDDQARKLLADKLKLHVRRHPSTPNRWQLVGCAT